MKPVMKVELRRALLQARLSLPVDVWQAKSYKICDRLQGSPLFTRSRTVLAYFSFRQEPDLSSLFALAKRWGFPRCAGDALSWHYWAAGEDLEINGFGIPEPKIDAPRVKPADVDLMLVPGVGCDRWGYRLGYGGGYYDRLLCLPEWQRVPKVAIIFDFAYLPELPQDPWDYPLTHCCTENAVLSFPAN